MHKILVFRNVGMFVWTSGFHNPLGLPTLILTSLRTSKRELTKVLLSIPQCSTLYIEFGNHANNWMSFRFIVFRTLPQLWFLRWTLWTGPCSLSPLSKSVILHQSHSRTVNFSKFFASVQQLGSLVQYFWLSALICYHHDLNVAIYYLLKGYHHSDQKH